MTASSFWKFRHQTRMVNKRDAQYYDIQHIKIYRHINVIKNNFKVTKCPAALSNEPKWNYLSYDMIVIINLSLK